MRNFQQSAADLVQCLCTFRFRYPFKKRSDHTASDDTYVAFVQDAVEVSAVAAQANAIQSFHLPFASAHHHKLAYSAECHFLSKKVTGCIINGSTGFPSVATAVNPHVFAFRVDLTVVIQ